ncbi:MAG: uracil-DNA glycosylase, partial [Synechococcus sp. LacPavin_0920_WC12_MAG_50_7]|nr:uracil-DNA glycosylase [Synechococcus sp. LacPavin_0920_WC12_MAG_50_7]
SCALAKQREQVVVGRGNPNASLMLIGEAPGQKEDACGQPFVGRAGQLLEQLLLQANLCSKSDLYICNVIKCRPPGNRKPSPIEIQECRRWLDSQINLINPALILLAGATAVAAILGIKAKLGLQRGRWHQLQERNYRPIYHPSYLLRFPSVAAGSPRGLTLQDLRDTEQLLRKN